MSMSPSHHAHEMLPERGIAEREVLQELGERTIVREVLEDDLLDVGGDAVGEILAAALQELGDEGEYFEGYLRLVRLVVHERDEVEALVEEREREVDVAHGGLRVEAEDVFAHRVDPAVVLAGHVLQLQIALALLVQLHVVVRLGSAVVGRIVAHEVAGDIEFEPAAVLLEVLRF